MWQTESDKQASFEVKVDNLKHTFYYNICGHFFEFHTNRMQICFIFLDRTGRTDDGKY